MNIFTELSLILAVATILAAFLRFLKQPLILAYVATGIVIGPYLLNLTGSKDTMSLFAEVGVALLLFIIGLNLNPKVLREIGGVALLSGISQIAFTSGIGFLILRYGFNFSPIAATYIAAGLAFSSTIIILKLLSDKNDLRTLYGKISIGFLLVQDLVAISLLVALSSLPSGGAPSLQIAFILARTGVFLLLLLVVSVYILPRVCRFFAGSQESLLLFSLAWGLGLASAAERFGFSVEIGALAAGIALSTSPYHVEIGAKMKLLRDFFIILFFIMLGKEMVFIDGQKIIMQAILLSLFVLVGNPFIMIVIMGLLGYSKRVSFLTGLTVAQISEFSLILIIVGIKVGHLSPSALSLMTLVGLITITCSTYLILYGDELFRLLAPYLGIFERKRVKGECLEKTRYEAILFGDNRIGYDFRSAFEKTKTRYAVVDFDPKTIERLTNERVACVYGDAGDPEFLGELCLDDIKMAISTIPNFETNALLIKKIRAVNRRAIVMVIAHTIKDALALYGLGAAYVVLPHFLGGEYASLMVSSYGFSARNFARERKKHLAALIKRQTLGHEHPSHGL
ncbi:MAG: cation:proton antiporter [Candidatus Jacksonbacteria bacterium]|nr:cation:proton antiporter [Candidatus Jacksonbacteria bacterium]